MPEVDRYRIVFYGSSDASPELKAKIELYHQQGLALSSMGKVRFHAGELPKDGKDKKDGLVMNLPVEQLGDVITVLRTEKPIYMAFHEGRAVLGTGIEPVGTGERNRPQPVHIVEAPAPSPEPEAPTKPEE